MKKIFFIISLVIISIGIIPHNNYGLDEAGDEIKLFKGGMRTMTVNAPKRIVIGNPKIADVTNVGKNELTVVGKGVGKTILTFWDNLGEHAYEVKVYAEDIFDIKKRIDSLLSALELPEVYTRASEEEGKVLILGKVRNSKERERIMVALGRLRAKIVDLLEIKEDRAVVEIDVQVLELSKDASRTLGFTTPGGVTLTEVGSLGLTGANLSTVFNISEFTREAFSFTLDALVQEGKAKILSRPRLACQSGKEAELMVGGEKPVFSTQVVSGGGGTGTTVSYKEYGIKLKIKPTITKEEQIKLSLNVDVSEVQAAETIGDPLAPSARAYPITKRTASTELFLNNEQTLGIGGLIKQKTEEDVRKTAFLGDIPVLGMLFRKKAVKEGGGQGERGDIELFIVLTPRIVSRAQEEIKGSEEPLRTERPSPAVAANTEKAHTPLDTYSWIVQQRIMENLTYPQEAKEAGFQGALKLSLRLAYTGQLVEIVVKDSSGYKVLDDNAISVAKRISAFPPFPSDIAEKELWIDVPIAYRLD